MRGSTPLLTAVTFTLLACSDGALAPSQDASANVANAQATAESNAVVYWNGIARSLVASNSSSAPFAIRAYALMAVAQHNAAAVVNDRAVHAAISAASVVTLSHLYPSAQASLDSLLQQYLANAGPDIQEAINAGRNAGARVVTYGQGDRFFAPWTGTVPTGPGFWFSSTPPVGANFGQAKTYFLLAGNQFRPAPHPAFGSATFQAALAEVRQISDTRTPEQDSIAKFWNMPNGTYTPPGYWNEEGARLTLKYRLNERKAAHLFALLNAVSLDAIVASHEAKFFYWLLRPTMADPAIQLAIGLPNFPSYPSNHAAISAGMAAILGNAFPSERIRLRQLADEAALSRVYGAIHYRFDGSAGLTLGRRIAEWAMDHNVALRQPYPLN
jgi:hypothetical protein